MRRFIYLDTDVLNSYLAQMDDGLLETHEIESQIGDSSTKQSQHTFDMAAGVDAKVLGKGIEGKIEYIFEKIKSGEQSEIYKDVQTKKLHDNAFERFMKHVDDNGLWADANRKVGAFIKFTGELSFVGLSYLSDQFGTDGLIEFMKRSQIEEIEKKAQETIDAIPRDQRRSKESEIKRLIQDAKKKSNENWDNVFSIIKMLKTLIPYKSIIASGDYLIATTERFFRDNPDIVAFKYGGKLSVSGYITNVVYGEEAPVEETAISPLATIQPQINKVMTQMLNYEKTIYIVHPIAIYYE